MTACIRCHRPMKHPTDSGLGPKCAAKALPVPAHERDLFGYDPALGEKAALARLAEHIEVLVFEAHVELFAAVLAARVELLA